MKLPDSARAIVSPQKIADYLLSPSHRAGKSKAAFFCAFGFSVQNWVTMSKALLRHAEENPVRERTETAYGVRYVIDGPMLAPDGSRLSVRSVWYIENEGEAPRFVTAHPLAKEKL